MQFTCIKLVQDQVGALFTVSGPMLLATLMLYPLVKKQDAALQGRKRAKRDILIFFVLALLGVFPAQVLVTWGTRRSLATNASLLMLTLPVCTALMAYAFLGERMNRIRWASFGIAVLGVLLCSDVDFSRLDFTAGYFAGNALIFLGVLGSAFYNSYGKKLLFRYSPMEMLFYTYVATLIILVPITIVEERNVLAAIPEFTGRTWWGLILLTCFHNFLSMVLFLTALQKLSAIQTALCNYLITFFGLPIAVFGLGESLRPAAFIGGLLVLASTLLVTLADRAPRALPTSESQEQVAQEQGDR